MCICINLVSVCGIELSPDESDRHHGHYTHDCGEEDDQPHNLLIQRVTCGTYNQTKKYLTSVIFEKAVLLYTGWSPSCWDYIISWRLLANIWPFWLQNDAIIDKQNAVNMVFTMEFTAKIWCYIHTSRCQYEVQDQLPWLFRNSNTNMYD